VSAAVFPNGGAARQLDRASSPGEVVRPEQMDDKPVMARLFTRILDRLSTLERSWSPRRADFEDLAIDSTTTKKYRLEHKFGGRVRWWLVDWSGAAAPTLTRDASSDSNTLVLKSATASAGTASVRVEEAG
jgi:hypothetical protein